MRSKRVVQRLQVEAEEQLRETRKGKQFKCERCQKWRGFDNGHGEGNECLTCWAEIEKKILLYVAEAWYRTEDSIVRYMLRQEPSLTKSRVESWLAELVEVEGSLHWFTRNTEEKMGTKAYSEEPLRYRFVPKAKRKKKDANLRRNRNQRPVRKLQAPA